MLIPVIDRLRPLIDLREQVVSFEPQPVITEDNLVVSIDTVIYYQVTDAKAAMYEIANYIQAIEQLTVTTLRNVIGGMTLERTLTSRDQVNGELRGVLDEATGKWGIRVNRVELKAVDPPRTIQEAMEKQMRADRDKRAAILTAEGLKQSEILTAEGEKQAAILRSEGERQSQILRAEGQAKAIETVFRAVHEGDADPKLLAYQYLQMLPQIAAGRQQHDLGHPQRAHVGAQHRERGVGRRPARRPVSSHRRCGTVEQHRQAGRRPAGGAGEGLSSQTSTGEARGSTLRAPRRCAGVGCGRRPRRRGARS